MRDKKGRFLKGIIPWNKGTNGLCKPNKTSFKKGHKFSKKIEEKRKETIFNRLSIKPNLKFNENLAYILGIIKGDGCININKYTKGHIVIVHTIDKSLANNFYDSLKKLNLNPYMCLVPPRNGISKKNQYRIQAVSKKFCLWYNSLSLNKIKKLLDNRKKIIAFLKGFYEAEGCLCKQIKNKKRLRITLTHTDIKLLKLTKNLANKLNFNFILNGPYDPSGFGKKLRYNFTINKQEEVKRFINVIKPCIKYGEKRI